jgi:hypothetical protein
MTQLFLLILAAALSVQTAVMIPGDVDRMTGAAWTGNLSYKDYQSGQVTMIASTLMVKVVDGAAHTWTFAYGYPKEPKANSSRSVTLSPDGTTFDGEKVIERSSLPGGAVKVVTEKAGRDNDKDATFRLTYLIADKSFSIKKEVRYQGTAEFFQRNEYSWTR